MNLLTLDFETYYDKQYSLKKLTIAEYVRDARFRAHGLAVRYPDGRAEFRADVNALLSELQAQYGEHLERTTVVFQNAYFDVYVLKHRFGLTLAHFIDTMLLAYAAHGCRGSEGSDGTGASLKALAMAYNLPVKKGNLDFMCGVREPSAAQFIELEAYAKNDVEITFQLALKLLPSLTRPAVELPLMMHTVRLFTERGLCVETAALDKLAQDVKAETEKWLADAGVSDDDVSRDARFVPLLEKALARTGRLVPNKTGKRGSIPATAKKDPAMLALLDDDDPVVAALAHARTQVKSEDQIVAKLETLKRIASATGGFLPVYLKYYGGHTGRFSGGQKFNLQNMGKDGCWKGLRKALVARRGHKFVIGDLGQIEARVLADLAGQSELVQAFAAGSDIYSELATVVFNEPIRKPRKDEPTAVKEYLDDRRNVGKFGVLGLGFSMGALKCYDQLRSKPQAVRLFETGILTAPICKQLVRTYREKNPRIVAMWKSMESGFRAALLYGFDAPVCGGRVCFQRQGTSVVMWIPSGRAVRYANARIENIPRAIQYMNDDGETAEFTPEGDTLLYGPADKDDKGGTTLYGGKLTENCVQAVARDILVEAILRLERLGWCVVLHVHDEIVLEVPADQVEAAEVALKSEMEATPVWAPGLPLMAEVHTGGCYEK
ncbi:MAG: DNA polymerase [Planctomycetota bacterium]